MAPSPKAIRQLEDLAERGSSALVSVASLVRAGFMRVEDIGDLKDAGCRFFETDDEDAEARVWVVPAEFLKAAREVGSLRAAEVVADLTATRH